MKSLRKSAAGALLAGTLLVAVGAPADAVTLEEALIAAYATSPVLRAGRAELRAIDENVAQAHAGWRPSITAQGSYGKLDQKGESLNFNPVNGDLTVQENAFNVTPKSYGATIRQPIFRGGRTIAGIAGAKSTVKAGRAVLHQTEQTVLLDTVTAYMDAFQAQSVLELNRNNVQVLRRQLEATRDRFEVGEITRTDVAQAEAALSAAIAARTLAEATLTRSRAAYARLVGELPTGLAVPENLPPLPKTQDDARATALASNPRLAAAIYAEEASGKAVRSAFGSLLPSVEVVGEYQKSFDQSTFSIESRSNRVMAQATWPLYQSGAAQSRLRQAKHTRNQRRIEILENERRVVEAVDSAWASVAAVQHALDSRKEQVRASEIALDGVRQEAMVGSRTTLDVLEAEQTSLDARVALVRATRDLHVTAFSLLAAVGNLTAEYMSLSVDRYDPAAHAQGPVQSLFGIGASSQ